MTKRRSLIATFAFVFALSFALICGITLFGGTLTAYAEGETPSADSEIKTYNVTLTQGTIEADGKTDTSTGSRTASLDVRAGTVVTITAGERRNAVFEKWTVSAVVDVVFADENSATTTFVMPKGGVWLEPKYKLIRSVTVENGTLEDGTTSKTYTEGDIVKIIAQATLGGKEFVKWVVTLGEVTLADENSPTTTFILPGGDVKITALYKSEHHLGLVEEIPATCTEDGIKRHYVCEDEGCGRKFTDETEAEEITDDSVLIIPKAHKFGAWIDEVPATDETTGRKGHKDCEFCNKHFDNDGNEIEDLTLYKTYSVLLRWGTLQADGKTSSGTSSGMAQLEVKAGTVVTITAPEKSDAEFVKWTVSGNVDIAFKDENSAMTTFVMPKHQVWLDCEYKAIGEPTPKHNVIIENGNGGGEFEAGQTVTITAGEAPEGKEFDKWVVVSGEVTLANANSASTTFVMPDGAVEIKATYKDKTPSGGGEEPGGETSGTDNPGGETPGTDDPSGENPSTENKGLSGGAIAGIVVGSVAVAGIGGFAIFWFVIKKKSLAELIAAIKGLFKKK